MSTARSDLERILKERGGELAADGLAEVVEEYIDFSGSAEDYFASVLRLPVPLCELYAALIFNTNVNLDGLAFAIPRYDHPQFLAALRRGLTLLGEEQLLTTVERAAARLNDDASDVLRSSTPNVTLDRELAGIHKEYFAFSKHLMQRIGDFLHANRVRVLKAADKLGAAKG
jgi:hypothetical protein